MQVFISFGLTISWFRDAVSEEGRTRSSLARDLCALEGWIGDRGEPCPGSARKALPVLARKLGLELPAAQAASGRGRRAGERKADYPDLSLRCRLAELGVVMLEPVSGDTDRRLWESMMATHHPQGRARAPGGQLRYRVCSSVHDRLGGIGFCAASWHRKARNDYIGWSADARAAHLSKAISNHRFLLLPGVRVHGLASRAPGLAAERVAGDREAAYKARPMMACSHVGPDHTGACYQAAGWQCCAQPTSGGPPGGAGGQAGDSQHSGTLPDLGPDVRLRAIVADRGRDSAGNRQRARKRGSLTVIPCRRTTGNRPGYVARTLCRARIRIEQAIGRLKRFKRIALRCEETATNFRSFIALAAAFILIKSVHRT